MPRAEAPDGPAGVAFPDTPLTPVARAATDAVLGRDTTRALEVEAFLVRLRVVSGDGADRTVHRLALGLTEDGVVLLQRERLDGGAPAPGRLDPTAHAGLYAAVAEALAQPDPGPQAPALAPLVPRLPVGPPVEAAAPSAVSVDALSLLSRERSGRPVLVELTPVVRDGHLAPREAPQHVAVLPAD